jgi:hypothetical protein
MFCLECGAALRAGANFCGNCGTSAGLMVGVLVGGPPPGAVQGALLPYGQGAPPPNGQGAPPPPPSGQPPAYNPASAFGTGLCPPGAVLYTCAEAHHCVCFLFLPQSLACVVSATHPSEPRVTVLEQASQRRPRA